jgi:hypothetical protein
MKAPPLAKNYKCLKPEERFRLILAASGRGDEAERDRLIRAGGRITLSMSDHAPYVDALNALAMHVFIDLLEEAARYHDAFDRLDSAEREDDDDDEVSQKASRAQRQMKTLKMTPTVIGLSGIATSTWPWPPVTCCARKRKAGSCFASG